MTRELNDNELESVAGGYINVRHKDSEYSTDKNGNEVMVCPERDYYVLLEDSSTGKALGTYDTESQAIEAAKRMGISTEHVMQFHKQWRTEKQINDFNVNAAMGVIDLVRKLKNK